MEWGEITSGLTPMARARLSASRSAPSRVVVCRPVPVAGSRACCRAAAARACACGPVFQAMGPSVSGLNAVRNCQGWSPHTSEHELATNRQTDTLRSVASGVQWPQPMPHLILQELHCLLQLPCNGHLDTRSMTLSLTVT
jgi:hypothetical protein